MGLFKKGKKYYFMASQQKQQWLATMLPDFDKAGNKPCPREHPARLPHATVTIPFDWHSSMHWDVAQP